MTILHTLLHFTWCLPQTLLGLIIRGCGHGEIVKGDKYNAVYVPVRWLTDSWFSLGRYIFSPLEWYENCDEYTIRHESGHSKQSLILGPLYLFVIALPSLIWHVWYYSGKAKKCSYYWFYTERWANKLAGINIE